MMRKDGRENNEIRPLKITRDFIKYPHGAVLIESGQTKVICTAFIEDKVPQFLKGTGKGWISAEYSMIPGANAQRKPRDVSRLKLDGRSAEIQRLVGRSLRSVVDLTKIGERTIWIDCDVIQADGGTRVASINGSFIALYDAINFLVDNKNITSNPIRNFVGAISVGIVDNEPMADLCYYEDSRAIADMNVVMTEAGSFVEIQATGEARPIEKEEMDKLLHLAEDSINQVIAFQKKTLGL